MNQDGNGEEQERRSGWPYEEDRMILGLLRDEVRSQVIMRSFKGAPLGVHLGELVDEQLERFYSLLVHGNTAVKGVFSEEELLLTADVCNGIIFRSDSLAQDIVFNFRDHLRYYPHRIEAFGVDGHQFLTKVEELDLLARYALVDVIERWWALDDEKRSDTTVTSLIDGTADPENFIHITI